MKRWTLYLAGATALVAGLVACPQFAPDDVCGYPGFCGDSSVDGSKDSGTDGPATCPSGNEPKDDPSCVSDALGIFVAPSANGGSDANPGTKESPVASLKTALQKAASGSKGFIFVCEGSYTESVDIAQTVSVFGGFKCADWSYTGALAKFTATKSDYVLHLDAANNVTIADVELDAIDAPINTGASSISAFVAASQNVKLERLTAKAGKGSDGPDGALANYSLPDAGALKGNDAPGIDGGAPKIVPCPGGDSTTGGGGGYGNGQDGMDGTPGPSNKGTLSACSGSNTGGGNGVTGAAGKDAPATTSLGTLTASGWAPATGASGDHGAAGQGGGGGAGYSNGGGGGGGAGGCGGAPGGGGIGGGGSVALLAFGSTVTVTSSVFVASDAGRGGSGVAGQPGASSGGAHGNGSGVGCSGGNGGGGGAGGGGAGGAGGVSIGVLSKGGSVSVDGSTTITVAPQGGAKGSGASANDGIDGVAQAQLAL